jgi:hypothetical protein
VESCPKSVFTDSAPELYGQKLYIKIYVRPPVSSPILNRFFFGNSVLGIKLEVKEFNITSALHDSRIK